MTCASEISAPLHRIGIPDEYAPVGPPTHRYRHYGPDAPGILARIRKVTAEQG
jgi:transketolase